MRQIRLTLHDLRRHFLIRLPPILEQAPSFQKSRCLVRESEKICIFEKFHYIFFVYDYSLLTFPVYTYKRNCLKVSGEACGNLIGVGVPGAVGDTEHPGILQISPRFAV